MSSQNQNDLSPVHTAPLGAQSSGGWPVYQSQHNIGRARYITSNDPRGYLPVWEYSLRDQPMMMDMDDGFVLWTSICKALGKSKADITRMIESDTELQHPGRLRRVKGGFLRVQGTWIPHSNAKALARKIAWEIRDDLVPFFGPEFPSTCLAPNDPGFADILAPRQRARRGTTTMVSGSQPSTSSSSPSQTPGQPWLPSSYPVAQRQNSAPGAIMASYSTGYGSPPRGNQSPSSNGSPHMQPPHSYQYSGQAVAQGRFAPVSGTSSPGSMIKEEPYTPDGSYTDAPGQYSASPEYPQYSNAGYPAQSNATYSSSQGSNAYYQPQYSQPAYATHPAAHQSHQYSSQVTTPTQTGFPSTSNIYASPGVSDIPPQPCNTYPGGQDLNRGNGYILASPPYQTAQQPAGSYQGQYQPSAPYQPYANESSVRYTAEDYNNDPARPSYGNEAGSSRADYGYGYGNGSAGMQGQPAQRTYQQQSQYGGAEYRDQHPPSQQQQQWGGSSNY